MKPETILTSAATSDNSSRREAIAVVNASKRYPNATRDALSSVNLSIREGEFFSLLGPSGCGKTTILRSLAGLERLTTGTLQLFGERIDHLPPNKRPLNTVFQHYALFPHMTVAENIAFGLKRLGKSRSEVGSGVARALQLGRLTDFKDRKPSQLSGGQQQRVALARALAPQPKILLLDEPLSALDLKLRTEMREELKHIQMTTGITFLFVTHDQDEALAMSDRMAVMSSGVVEQIGTPEEVYYQPESRFVATFIGDTNLLGGTVLGREGGKIIIDVLGGTKLRLPDRPQYVIGEAITLSARPEHVTGFTQPAPERCKTIVIERTFLGSAWNLTLTAGGTKIVQRLPACFQTEGIPDVGSTLFVSFDERAAQILPGHKGKTE